LIDESTKIIWICSPNNPTGNTINREDIETILNNFNGIVVVDEAYINFSRHKSLLQELPEYPNLVVLQTFSKAWGMAALRLGVAFASAEIIRLPDKIKPPYNINQATQDLALQALEEIEQVNSMIKELVSMREALTRVFEQMPIVEKVYPSDANFLLVKVKNARKVYEYLLTKGIVVRDRSNVQLCENCLRITIGTEDEITLLVKAIKDYQRK
jgi:histidinol-phosphate aminotransferase